MTGAESLTAHDRCSRSAFLSKGWARNVVSPTSALYQAIEAGLEYEGDEDPGQVAGDSLFTIATDRGLDTPQQDLYGHATHLAALADILTWFLRPTAPWQRPEDVKISKEPWISSAFLDPSGLRLRRILLVDRWSEERARAESHSWRTIGECVAYDLPLVQTVLVIGQNREGRRHSPWSKAWTHPVNHALRMRKRSGEGFGGKWKGVFREETEFSREHWIDAMTNDGILGDVAFEVEVPVPEAQAKSKIRHLMEKKLAEIKGLVALPDPCPSQCDGLTPCQFVNACWNFTMPSDRNGFVRIP